MPVDFDFEDIRPYNDEEVGPVLNTLLRNEEFFNVICHLRMPRLPVWAFPLVRPFLSRSVRQSLVSIKDIHDVQLLVEHYLNRCLLDTTREFAVHLEQPLDPGKAYLFISNHRDIVLDPALCNLACHRMGRGTVRIAIGDNLLSKPFASDLMRLNKSFIVKRGVENRREKLHELKKLSAYMRSSIASDNQSCWIAQREGRAKDGLDRTDTAVLKMLMLSKEPEQSFGEAIDEFHLVPVSISYEWDPCDLAKARELAHIERDGIYEKDEHEDIQSIAAGIQGWKGRVDLHFGREIQGNFETAEALAIEIDRQIVHGYRIQASNAVAYQRLEGRLPDVEERWPDSDLESARTRLAERVYQLAGDQLAQEQLVRTYANPAYASLGLSA